MTAFTEIRFINQAEERIPPDVVLFQTLPGTGPPIVWMVIRGCGYGHEQKISMAPLTLTARTPEGHFLPETLLDSTPRSADSAGMIRIRTSGEKANILNRSPDHFLRPALFRAHRLLALGPVIGPGEAHTISVHARLMAAVSSLPRAQEGRMVPKDLVAGAKPIDLTRIRKADLSLVGGGYGSRALPYSLMITSNKSP